MKQDRKPHPFACLVTIISFFSAATMAAVTVDAVNQPTRRLAGYALKSTNLPAGSTTAYRPWFDNTSWQGDLIEYTITNTGLRSTDVDYTVNPPTTAGSNWSARTTFASNIAGDAMYWSSARKIITSTTGINQLAFRWNNLTAGLKQALDSTGDPLVAQNDVLDYIRGDRSKEGVNFRTRQSILGDIIHSTPLYVGQPTGDYSLPGYATFKDTARAGRLYVGANDGMLHVFNESDGSEVYAYIPSMLIHKLKNLTNTPYSHTFFVDGALRAGDAYIGATWKTILAGGMGAGEKGFFVLDITNPNLSSETTSTGTNKKILWEKTSNDLGYIHGAPSIVKLPDGNWYVATGNGYASTNGDAQLYLLNLSNGNTTTMTALMDTDNGLSVPTFIDINQDYMVDFAYAGDLKGNLWRFDLSNLNSSPTKLFSAGIDKPITVAPDVTFHPNGDYLVYFGTGSLLSNEDLTNTSQQSVYAIWDRYSAVTDTCRSGVTGDLLCQTFTIALHSSGTTARVATQYPPNWKEHKGWRIDLPDTGERLLDHPQLRAGRLEFVSTTPTQTGANNWLFNLDYLSGGDGGKVLFDLNNNQLLDNADKVTVSAASRTPVAIDLGAGYRSQPNIAHLGNGTDVLFINGLDVDTGTTATPCIGACAGGLEGGYVDVDTDTALGGATNDHTHEYDNQFNLTYMDYFALKDGHELLTSATTGIDAANQKLIAVISNADLSPGGVLTIGNKQWNVVEYQKMTQQKLQAWDGVSALLDNDGDPLAFTLNQVNSTVGGTGTVRISFDDQAIITGGLIPTQTSCVKDKLNIVNDRWRDGALTLQLLDLAKIDVNVTPKAYTIQDPTDLVENVNLSTGTIVLNENGVRYGGIHASLSNPAAFVYESTLFWHYKGVCYGDSQWTTDRSNYGFTIDEFNTFLSDLNATASTELATLRSYVCTAYDKNNDCTDADYSDLLTTITKHIMELLPNYLGDPELLATTAASFTAIAPSPPTDATGDFSPVLGPNPPKGRVSWIDLRR